MKKSLVLIFLLVFSIVTALAASSSLTSVTAENNSTTIVYFDLPTINGTVIDEEFTVNIKIRNAYEISVWQAGLIFNPSLLECTGFSQGDFFSSVGPTFWQEGNIDNTTGVITYHSCIFFGEYKASGNGTLGYLTFKVKASGVSDLHFRDVIVAKSVDYVVIEVPINIIDVYTVIVNATAHKVVTVSNSTGLTGAYQSGFSDHAFNPTLKEISFDVTGPHLGFSNVTIPKTLLEPEGLYGWTVIIDEERLSTTDVIVTGNTTHTSVYFTYTPGVHKIQITTRFMFSTISMALSSNSIILESNVTVSGGIDPLRENATVEILYRLSGATEWASLANVTTNQNSNYSYTWTPTNIETYEFMARWEGDDYTLGDESDPPYPTLVVQSIPPSIYVFPADGLYVIVESNSTVFNFDFNETLNEISFNVTRPYGDTYFSNVTIPIELGVSFQFYFDNELKFPIKTENQTHTFLYFTYDPGTHKVEIKCFHQIPVKVSSTISITLSSKNITLGSNVTVSGGIDPLRENATVEILYRLSGATEWASLANVTTNQNSNYSYTWTPTNIETYEFMARWEGDDLTEGDESDPPYPALTVEETPEETPADIDPYVVVAVVVPIIIIAAIVVYFVKFRKPV